MSEEIPDSRLSRIRTRWPMVQKAAQGSAQSKRSAQKQILESYGKAVHRYLLAVVRDPDAAAELFQDFAQRFVEGKLQGADPARGRFRDYLKGVLSHLIADYYNRRTREARSQPLIDSDLPVTSHNPPSDSIFSECCREELLNQAWDALAEVEKQTGHPPFTALRLRAERPDIRSQELAEVLSKRLGRPVTAGAARQTLHRARERFADLLLERLALSLGHPTHAEVEQELIELRLLGCCQAALERRAGRG